MHEDTEPRALEPARQSGRAAADSGRPHRTVPPRARPLRSRISRQVVTIAAATPLWKRPAMTPLPTPASRSSATARTRSQPRSAPVLLRRSRRRRRRTRRFGALLKLDGRLALVVDHVPYAENRGDGVEQPACARGGGRVDAAPCHREHIVPALGVAALDVQPVREPAWVGRVQVRRRHPPWLPDRCRTARHRHRGQMSRPLEARPGRRAGIRRPRSSRRSRNRDRRRPPR